MIPGERHLAPLVEALQRHDGRDGERLPGRMHFHVIVDDRVDPVLQHRHQGVLPGPDRERTPAQRLHIRVQHQRLKVGNVAHRRRSGRNAVFSTKFGKLRSAVRQKQLPIQPEHNTWAFRNRRVARYCAPPKTWGIYDRAATAPQPAVINSVPDFIVSSRKSFLQRQRPRAKCRCRRCRGPAGGYRSPPPARRRRAARPRRRVSGKPAPTSSASPCTSRTGGRPVSSAARVSGAIRAPENARMARGGGPVAQAGEQRRSSRPG